jgi:hypothetical protein
VKRIRTGRRVHLVAGDDSLISSAGAALLVETARLSGLAGCLSEGLAPWRAARARHDPGKVLLDVAVTVALGGDCLADVGLLRAQPELFGPVASDPTVSRLIATLSDDVDAVVAAVRAARASTRQRVGRGPAGGRRPGGGRSGRDAGDGALGQGRCRADVQAHVRVPSGAP